MKRNFLVLVVAVVVGAVLWPVVRHSRSAGNGSELSGSINAVKGKAAPDFQLQDLDGKSVRLSDYRGKAVVLNFWATWCAPCRAEIPWFVDIQKQYASRGLAIVGVAMDDSGKAKVAAFAQKMGINYPVLLGNQSVGDSYGGVDALPVTFYIGRDGRVVNRVFGLRSEGELEENIKSLVGASEQSMAAETH